LCYEEPAAARESTEAVWGALLASQVLVETADLDRLSKSNQRHVDHVRHSLVQLIKGHELPPVERALAGNNLAVLGDPRPGVGTIFINGIELPDIELCYVPPGPFWMGSPDDDPIADEDEKPLHQLDLDYGYWIGRYPVTVAQFWTFLVQSDYEMQGSFMKFTGDDPATWPARYVTWDDALAFCRWLTEWAMTAAWLPPGMQVTLPSEAEWEKAARGGLMVPKTAMVSRLAEGLNELVVDLVSNPDPQRRYPMGETLQPHRANYAAAAIGKPSAVGIFPPDTGLYGTMDLAGNVFDWTRSNFKTYPYESDDGREILESRDIKVIRGGTYFSDDKNWPRCSFRDGLYPFNDFHYLGFRVCVVSPFSSGL
jgi:formylglycine-generating enzyme required for sulfatase activity